MKSKKEMNSMLTDEQIKKFQSIYKKRFGKEISKEEALESGTKLVSLLALITKPIKEAESVENKGSKK